MQTIDEIIQEIQNNREYYIRQITVHSKVEAYVLAHREKFEALVALGIEVQVGDSISFNGLTHEQTVQVIKVLGGKWDKQLSYSGEGMHYTRQGEPSIMCYNGAPPPSCKIVEVDEVVPAQEAYVRKVKKIQCVESAAAASDSDDVPNPVKIMWLPKAEATEQI